MKLLFDTHHSRLGAARLRDAEHDVIAASDDPAMTSLPDEELLRVAHRLGRALVTENVKDFDRIVRAWSSIGEHHSGVIFTSPWRYHRASQAYPANLVTGLTLLLEKPPAEQADMVLWLP